MYQVRISILNEKGTYPKKTVLCGDVGYAALSGIPLLFHVTHKHDVHARYSSKETIFKAAFLFTNKQFPPYHFPKKINGDIFISSGSQPNLKDIVIHLKHILIGTCELPVLYSPNSLNYEDRLREISTIRNKPEYIDLFNFKSEQSFLNLIQNWRNKYSFSQHKCSAKEVKEHYSYFENSSRMIHIALYYYTNAANLTIDGYLEDAGINLHLAVEAIIKDYMAFESVKDKAKAITSLLSKIWPSDWGTDYLTSLWQSRNKFLAHVDENMFTEFESINDPDQYCCDTFESVSLLISKYIEYKNNRVQTS